MSKTESWETMTNNETTVKMFQAAFTALGIPQLLASCGITKAGGFGASSVFLTLLLLVFTGKNLYNSMNSRYRTVLLQAKKDTYYRFLKDPHFNWGRFILRLSFRVSVVCCNTFTGTPRPCFLVLDDSIIRRERSKCVELLSTVYDHVNHDYPRCFNLLLLGWTDGYTFLPVQYLMMASKKHLVKDALKWEEKVDYRTCGGKVRKMAVAKKAEAAVAMVKAALEEGFQTTCLLVDTWFTNEPFIHAMSEIGMDTIGMLKDIKQQYWYKGRLYDLQGLRSLIRFDKSTNVWGYITVQTRYRRIPVKLVFAMNKNNKDEYVIILSTNVDLTAEEIITYYGNRWSIECAFKVMKGMLDLGKEFQTRSYDATISTTALAITRYILLEYLHRINTDYRTIDEMCRELYDEVPRIEFDEALTSLFQGIMDLVSDKDCHLAKAIKTFLVNWYVNVPESVKGILPILEFSVPYGKADIEIPDYADEAA